MARRARCGSITVAQCGSAWIGTGSFRRLGRRVAAVEPQPILGGRLQRIRVRNLAVVTEPVALSAVVISAQG
jgi:hypothetical protein